MTSAWAHPARARRRFLEIGVAGIESFIRSFAYVAVCDGQQPLPYVDVNCDVPDTLGALVGIVARRILLADKIAAAKFGTGRPIDDSVRERAELAAVADTARFMGIDPDVSVRFVRAQIEANKLVQRGLHRLWSENPELRPLDRPDLSTGVRPELDEITVEIMRQLQVTEKARETAAPCTVEVLEAKLPADLRAELGPLHREALAVALQPICCPQPTFGR